MAAMQLTTSAIAPDMRLLDDAGRDWTWAFVLFADLPIPGAVGYKVDTLGRVWTSKVRGWSHGRRRPMPGDWRPLSLHSTKWGHLRALICIEGKCRPIMVHRLVLGAFVGPCPEGMEGCHNNGNPADNRLSNLRWDTPHNNQMDKLRHGTMPIGENSPAAMHTEDQIARTCEMLALGILPWRIARATGVSLSTVHSVRSGETWTHVSCRFKFAPPERKNFNQGVRSARALYTEDDVREMRRLSTAGVSNREIASRFSGSEVTIGKIVRGVSYANV